MDSGETIGNTFVLIQLRKAVDLDFWDGSGMGRISFRWLRRGYVGDRRRDEIEKRVNGRDVRYCLRAQGIFWWRGCTGIKRRRMVWRQRAKNNGMMRFGDVWSLKKDDGETRWFANFCISPYLCKFLYNRMYFTSRNSQRFVRYCSSLRNLKTSP